MAEQREVPVPCRRVAPENFVVTNNSVPELCFLGVFETPLGSPGVTSAGAARSKLAAFAVFNDHIVASKRLVWV